MPVIVEKNNDLDLAKVNLLLIFKFIEKAHSLPLAWGS